MQAVRRLLPRSHLSVSVEPRKSPERDMRLASLSDATASITLPLLWESVIAITGSAAHS